MNPKISRSILILDLFWIAMAFALAYAVRYQHLVFDVGLRTALRRFFPEVGSALLIWIFLYLSKNLDGFRGSWHLPTVISQITVAVFYLMALLLVVAFLQKDYYSRLMLLLPRLSASDRLYNHSLFRPMDDLVVVMERRLSAGSNSGKRPSCPGTGLQDFPPPGDAT